MSPDYGATELEEIALLEEWLDTLMGGHWAQQRAANKAKLAQPLDSVMYLSWLREVVATWRLSRRGETDALARRN